MCIIFQMNGITFKQCLTLFPKAPTVCDYDCSFQKSLQLFSTAWLQTSYWEEVG